MDESRKPNRLFDLLRRSPQAAETPDIPEPPGPDIDEGLLPDIEPVERHYQNEFIDNMSFTTEDLSFFTGGKELVTKKSTRKGKAGCGCVVSGFGENNYKEENGNKEENCIVGFCDFCLEEARKLAAKGELLPDQIGWAASYCKNCQAECSRCHRKTCAHHTQDSLCSECKLVERREKLVWGPMKAIASRLIHKKPETTTSKE